MHEVGDGCCLSSRLTAVGFVISAKLSVGRRPNGFLRMSLNDRTIIFLVILLAKTVSVA